MSPRFHLADRAVELAADNVVAAWATAETAARNFAPEDPATMLAELRRKILATVRNELKIAGCPDSQIEEWAGRIEKLARDRMLAAEPAVGTA